MQLMRQTLGLLDSPFAGDEFGLVALYLRRCLMVIPLLPQLASISFSARPRRTTAQELDWDKGSSCDQRL